MDTSSYNDEHEKGSILQSRVMRDTRQVGEREVSNLSIGASCLTQRHGVHAGQNAEKCVPVSVQQRKINYSCAPICLSVMISTDSEIVMVDLGFGDDFFEQDRSWDDFGTTISGI